MPSGVWDATEYPKLLAYDVDTGYQPPSAFLCHQQSGHLCSGWLAVHGADQLLAVRLGVITGRMDMDVLDYSTDVPLWGSGAEAAAHGMRDIDSPPPEAVQTMLKVTRSRARRK